MRLRLQVLSESNTSSRGAAFRIFPSSSRQSPEIKPSGLGGNPISCVVLNLSVAHYMRPVNTPDGKTSHADQRTRSCTLLSSINDIVQTPCQVYSEQRSNVAVPTASKMCPRCQPGSKYGYWQDSDSAILVHSGSI